MISIWLIIATCLLLGVTIVMVAPITVCFNYTYAHPCDNQDTNKQIIKPATEITLILFWGLLKPSFRLRAFGQGSGGWTPDFKVGAKLKSKSGVTLAQEKTNINLKQIVLMLRRVQKLYQIVYPALLFLRQRIVLKKLHWQTRLGLGEPHYTGLAVGMLWALKTNLTAIIYNSLKNHLALPKIKVDPLYQTNLQLQMQLACIFSFRLSHIIYAGMMIGWLSWKNYRKIGGN